MSDDELAWLLELENPSPPGPLPADPDADRWREHPETDQAAPDQAAPDHAHAHAHAAASLSVGLDQAASVTDTAAGVTGPGLAVGLENIDAADVSEYDLVEMIAGYQRVAAWAQSRMIDVSGRLARRPALSAVSRTPAGDTVINAAADELAPRLGVSRFAAQRMVKAAELFRTKLEDTGVALRAGRIDYAKCTVLIRMLGDQPADVAWEVQQDVLPDVQWMTVTQLEKAVAKAIIAVDPYRATARHRAARDQRRVGHPRVLPDGMASLYAVLPATDAAGLDLALEAAARTAKAAGDTRTLVQLRADALALLGHGALEKGFIGLPAPGGDHAPSSAGACDQATSGTPGCTETPPSAPVAPRADSPGRTESAPYPSTDPPAADDPPVFDTGGSFLRTPHMPIGTIGGRLAQIQVNVPLSVLLPPEVLSNDGTGGGRWLARLQGDSSAAGHPPPPDAPDVPGVPGAHGAADPPGALHALDALHAPDPPGALHASDAPDDELPDIPEGWYPGPGPAEVAELTGYGPITPDVAQALAYAGGTWQRLVTDPLSGTLLDVGRKQYRPPAAIEDFVRLRDGTCVRAGCSSPARTCQSDHMVPWSFGGITSADTLACLCPRDHVLKTAGISSILRDDTGAIVWTSPTGHRYRRDDTGRIKPLPPASAVQAAARAVTGQGFGDEPPF